MTEIISVVSGKGGVGKTTLVSNLAVALTKLGGKVLVIDGNVSGANLGIHLGVPSVYPVSLNDVLHKDAFITQAIYRHASGFNIIPASLNAL
ncbi:MAG: AAA family ATPase, partial [Candidatus Aenigmarchaeota archaeon]|nr:AAA family ATPase [Candidatus Aenigmarchaeota archaeon]